MVFKGGSREGGPAPLGELRTHLKGGHDKHGAAILVSSHIGCCGGNGGVLAAIWATLHGMVVG